MTAIDVENLSFAYAEEFILKNVSFKINKGEFIGLIGPNGGGKTTLLKLLMGLLKPNTGKILILGTSPKAARKAIAYVPQILRFDKNFPISLLELVMGGKISSIPWWGKFKEADKIMALNILEELNLIDFKDMPFGTLSGGQAQRALIARALISNPEILLLDEPTANVDLKAQEEIHSILRKISKEKTILMVTHDLKAVVQDMDRVLCVQRELLTLNKDQVCEHFAIGLYHSPYTKMRGK